jgi:hypothetical protein
MPEHPALIYLSAKPGEIEPKEKKGRKEKKRQNIQQQVFAGGHPPDYFPAPTLFQYPRSNGIGWF